MRNSRWIWKSIRVIGGTAGTIFSVFLCFFLSGGASFGQSTFNPNPKTAEEAIEQVAMGRLVYSGIMEKYPNLKFIAHHCGAMAPFFSARIPLGAAAGEGEIMKLTKPPVEYFKRFYGDTVLGGNTSAMMCGYTFFGADHMVFGTDYPYPGDVLLEAVIKAIERMNIAEDEKAKIFSKNARQLLHLA